jgi:putative CocE/NonD family hydrolase
VSDAAPDASACARLPLAAVDALRTSRYLRAHDGVAIAIDAYVPPSAAPVPTIVRQTRYGRSLAPRTPFRALVQGVLDHYQAYRRAFLAAGYAWIDVDVRGSGASGGTQYYAWNPDEVRDGATVVDWIVAQPWSNGKVGALGISYDGTAAEMLLVNRHPAVRAVAPMFSLWDAYADIAFPGGVHLAWFTEQWGRFNALLDRNAPHEALARVAWMLAAAERGLGARGVAGVLAALGGLGAARFQRVVAGALGRITAGVRPVDAARLAAVVAAHAANYDVDAGARRITFRDDRDIVASHPDATCDSFSPHAFAPALAASGAAVYSYSGWRDGGYTHAAIKRHLALPGARLTLGPWIHSGRLAQAPFARARAAAFDHAGDLLAFFGPHLAGTPADDGAPVRWFTMGEERWKSGASWPPRAETRALHLAPGGALSLDPPRDDGEHARDRHRCDPAAGTGLRSRWRCLIAPVAADYPDRAARAAHLCVYDSAPLAAPLEVTGHPLVVLHAAWLDDDDGRVFAYLEDVAPDGRVAYVTEGMLRALHRAHRGRHPATGAPQRTFTRAAAAPLARGEIAELVFDLLPISYRFAAGHRVRLALAGGDADSFVAARPTTLELHRTRARPSRLELPVVVGA